MAQQARRTTTRRRYGKNLPGWQLLFIGLALGLLIMWTVEHMFQGHRPLSGIAGLFVHHPAANPPIQPAVPPAVSPPKPKFDFYTILPDVETVIPDRTGKSGTKAATPNRPEKGIRYILQAAAYASNSDADHLRARLALAGLEAYTEKVVIGGRGAYYRVRLGPFARLQDMDATDRKLAKLGIKAIRLKVKKVPGT
ncbi:MAG: SPOR domain-containing protein [Acidiferrobacterales bacterium]